MHGLAMSTREPQPPHQAPSPSSALPSVALPPFALPPQVGIGPHRSRGRHEREFHAAMRRVWALPLAHQHEVAATLIEFLGGPLGTEPAVRDEVRRRAEALTDLRRAIEWLGLREGEKPKGREYDRAADALGLMSRSVVIKAWEKWDNAQRVAAGEWIPLTPAQRALKRATSGRKRSHETYFAGIREAVMHRGSQDADARARALRALKQRRIAACSSPRPSRARPSKYARNPFCGRILSFTKR